MKIFSVLLLVLLLFCNSGCLSAKKPAADQVDTGLSDFSESLSKELVDLFKKNYSADEPVLRDDYYTYGVYYEVDITYALVNNEGFLNLGASLKDFSLKMEVVVSLGDLAAAKRDSWSAYVFSTDRLAEVITSNIQGSIQDKLNGMISLDSRRLQPRYSLVKQGFIYRPLKQTNSQIELSIYTNQSYAEKYISPEEQLAVKEKRKREQEAMGLLTLSVYVAQNPFYYSNAERIFLEWGKAVIKGDNDFLEQKLPPMLKKLNQNELYEFKVHKAEFFKWIFR